MSAARIELDDGPDGAHVRSPVAADRSRPSR